MLVRHGFPRGSGRRSSRLRVALMAIALLAGTSLNLAATRAVAVAVTGVPAAVAARAAPTAYVVNGDGNSVTPIDTATNTPGKSIKVGTGPDAIAIAPNGATAYVVNSGNGVGNGTVTPISTATGKPGKPIKVGYDPDAIAITPNGATAYVVNHNTVTPISTATRKPGKPIKVGTGPDAIAITPNGATAYVADAGTVNALDGTVTPIQIATDRPGAAISVDGDPAGIAITPNGATAYVSNGGGYVTPIDTATNRAGKFFQIDYGTGFDPGAIAITPNGSTAYLANSAANTVVPIATATNAVGRTITVGNGPSAIVVSASGSTAYVANSQDDTVSPIATATGRPGKPIKVGSFPVAIAVTPAPAGWASQTSQPQAMTSAGPALGFYGAELYAAWKGETSDKVVYAAEQGSRWLAQGVVSGAWGTARTAQAPALVSYGKPGSGGSADLYAFWTAQTRDRIYYSAYNGNRWSAQRVVSGSWGTAVSNQGPAVTVVDGDLLAAWRGKSSGRLFYSVYDGSTWARQVGTGLTSADAPAVVDDPATGGFVMAWTTSADRVDLIHCRGTGAGACGVPVATLRQPLTNAAPALAFLGTAAHSTLFLAWKGKNTDRIGYAASFGKAGFTPQEFEPQALTNQRPALTVSGFTAYAGWKGKTGSHVWYAAANDPY